MSLIEVTGASGKIIRVPETALTTWGPFGNFRAAAFMDGDRYREMDRKQSYYDCTQHDLKRYDFDGRITQSGPGIGATQPLIGEQAKWFVPLKMRRPSSPYRLSRVIVASFTNMLFGENRFPTIIVAGDSKSQDFVQTLSRASKLPVHMIRARDLGGAMGTGCLSWCYIHGKPRIKVHNPKNVYVHEWEDRDEFKPAHVIEIQLKQRDEWNREKRKMERVQYWHRRDWTLTVDIVFHPVKKEDGREPVWEPDVDKSVEHNDGVCHFVWIQNLPADTEDGLPDYDGLYDNFDAIDILYSTVMRGATLNLDPTLMLKLDADLVMRTGVKKGSDNALIVGKDGDASYLELGGQSLQTGIEIFNSKRRSALEVAQCVVADPNEVAAQGVSSVALKTIYAPMLGKCDVLREQYAGGMVRLLEAMLHVARKLTKTTVTIYDKDGNPEEAELEIKIPPKVEKEPVLDEMGVPTGEEKIELVDREPGEGEEVELQWGPYFMPTPNDQSLVATTLSTATGGKAFVSKQTAVEIASSFFGRDPAEEWKRVEATRVAEKQEQQEMFAEAGGKVDDPNQLPPGAEGDEKEGGDKPPFGGGKPFGKKPFGKKPFPPKGPPAEE